MISSFFSRRFLGILPAMTALSMALPVAVPMTLPMALPAHADQALVTGSATYLERIAVPSGAILIVELLDTSQQDVRAPIISLQRYSLAAVPHSFSLPYDPALIDPRMNYDVAARVEVDGKIIFRTTTSNPALTQGGTTDLDVTMQRMKIGAMPSLVGTKWRATVLDGEILQTDNRPELFIEQGRAGIHTGCNRFNGPIEMNNRSLTFSDKMAGTMMACPPPYNTQETSVLRTLAQVTAYVRSGNELELMDADGLRIMRLTLIND
jgi:putative lipoprotein